MVKNTSSRALDAIAQLPLDRTLAA